MEVHFNLELKIIEFLINKLLLVKDKIYDNHLTFAEDNSVNLSILDSKDLISITPFLCIISS